MPQNTDVFECQQGTANGNFYSWSRVTNPSQSADTLKVLGKMTFKLCEKGIHETEYLLALSTAQSLPSIAHQLQTDVLKKNSTHFSSILIMDTQLVWITHRSDPSLLLERGVIEQEITWSLEGGTGKSCPMRTLGSLLSETTDPAGLWVLPSWWRTLARSMGSVTLSKFIRNKCMPFPDY